MPAADKPRQLHKVTATLLLTATILLGLATCLLFYLNRETPVPASFGSTGGMRDNTFEWVSILIQAIAYPLAPASIGYLIIGKRPHQRIGWFLLTIGLMYASTVALQEWVIYGTFTGSGLPGTGLGSWISNWLWIVLFALILLMLALFPDGHFLSRRWRSAILVSTALFVLPTFVQAVVSTPLSATYNIPNPFFAYENEGIFTLLANAGTLFLPVTALLILGEILVRFHRSRERERQRMKWLLSGMIFMTTLASIGLGLSFQGYVWGNIMVSISFFGPFVGIGVALLWYRLYDIDVIIRKTIVYTVLTVILALVFFGIVTLASSLVTGIAGQDSPLVIVTATLAIAALFTPLRSWIQNWIDRRFYRHKYNAEQVLARFARLARDETDLDKLVVALRVAVEDTLQPDSVSIWIRKPKL